MRVFAGLASDPFFMDVEAAIRTDVLGRLSFETATNTVQHRDVLSIVVEVPIASILERFNGATLIAAASENIVTRRGKPIRIERLGRPEIKNLVLANTTRDPRTQGIELRDLYNREDAFALSREYRPLYESRLPARGIFASALSDPVQLAAAAREAEANEPKVHRRWVLPVVVLLAVAVAVSAILLWPKRPLDPDKVVVFPMGEPSRGGLRRERNRSGADDRQRARVHRAIGVDRRPAAPGGAVAARCRPAHRR